MSQTKINLKSGEEHVQILIEIHPQISSTVQNRGACMVHGWKIWVCQITKMYIRSSAPLSTR